MMKYTIFLTLIFSLTFYQKSRGQDSTQIIYRAQIDELLEVEEIDITNTEIYSASRQYESLFETSLSASVLSYEEIKLAGCTSIPEAFRLLPGLIVREMSNGNYDVHIRGMDNVSPNNLFSLSLNTSTLVMINNRIVHNFIIGTTPWETLPIGIEDIEQIEVIRGSSSVLFGVNAASGVINIITKKDKRKGYFGGGSIIAGNPTSFITNIHTGYRSENFSARLTFNSQDRERYESSVFHHHSNSYVPLDSVRSFATGREIEDFTRSDFDYDKSLVSRNVSIFTEYVTKKDLSLQLNAGIGESIALTAYADNNNTVLRPTDFDSYYVQLSTTYKDLFLDASYNGGNVLEESAFNTYDFNLEYNLNIRERLFIKPLISYRNSTFEDFTDVIAQDIQTLENIAAAISLNYSPFQELKLTAGGRVDAFNNPSDYYFAYQFGATYLPKPNILLRANTSRAYRAPLFLELYFNQSIDAVISQDPLVRLNGNILGDPDINLVRADLIEIGARYQYKDFLFFDLEIYRNHFSDFSEVVQQETTFEVNANGFFINGDVQVQNTDLEAIQYGITLSSSIELEKLRIQPYITWQQTDLLNYSPYLNLPSTSSLLLPYSSSEFNIFTTQDKEHEATPEFYGGFIINYKPNKRLSFNAHSYFWTEQTFYHRLNATEQDGNLGVYDIDDKLLLNFTGTFNLTGKIDTYLSIRNILDNDSVEFARAARIGRSWWGGLSLTF